MKALEEKDIIEMVDKIRSLQTEIGRVMVGQSGVISETITALLGGGHVLLEGVPGLGKTTLIKSLGKSLDLKTGRIQFTPDLMPADILGTQVLLTENGKDTPTITFQKGPIFNQVLLADEINRATPKTQSALLEAMQETTVTIGGKEYTMDEPFMVLATQNPIEMEGTYPLPEAQLDRFFFKILVPFPTAQDMLTIMDRTTGGEEITLRPQLNSKEILQYRNRIALLPASDQVKSYAVRLTLGTHRANVPDKADYGSYIRHGASPRGAQCLLRAGKVFALLDGRIHLTIDDIRMAAKPALRHRILLSFEGEAEGITTDQIITSLISEIPERV